MSRPPHGAHPRRPPASSREKGYHGTSIGDLAEAIGVQKGSLYAHIASKQDLLYETMREGRPPSTRRSTRSPSDAAAGGADPPRAPRPPARRRRAARRRDRVRAEWRYLEGERRDEIVAERRRYEERIRALFREGRELGELRTDLDESAAALLLLSARNWAYTWLKPGRDTDELADRFYALLVDGMRGYSTPA